MGATPNNRCGTVLESHQLRVHAALLRGLYHLAIDPADVAGTCPVRECVSALAPAHLGGSMVGAVLLAAAITLAPPAESAAVFANRTAFTEACTGTANTFPDRLARQARTALAALGWEVGGAVGPGFTRRAAAAGAASCCAWASRCQGVAQRCGTPPGERS